MGKESQQQQSKDDDAYVEETTTNYYWSHNIATDNLTELAEYYVASG